MYAETAFARAEGDLATKGVALGHWTFDYAVSDEWEVGGQLSLPVFVFNAGPRARWSRALTKYVHVGVAAQVNLVLGFSAASDLFIAQYGGGPILSLGTEDLSATFSFPVHGIHFESGDDEDDWWVAIPSVGFGASVHERVKLLFEFYIPFGGDADGLWGGDDGFDLMFLLVYGLRVHGERFYGDIAFAVPFFENSLQVLEYMPLGYPVLNFGFTL